MHFLKTPNGTNEFLKNFALQNKAIYKTENNYWSFSLFDLRQHTANEYMLDAVRAVFAIPLTNSKELLLVNDKKRGWEFPGGHLSKEELLNMDLKAALERETLEESGYSITIGEPIVAAIIHNKESSINKDLNCPYPTRSVMLYFDAKVKDKVQDVSEPEILDSAIFDMKKSKELLTNRNSHIYNLLFSS